MHQLAYFVTSPLFVCKCLSLGSLRAAPGPALPVRGTGRGALHGSFSVQFLVLQGYVVAANTATASSGILQALALVLRERRPEVRLQLFRNHVEMVTFPMPMFANYL